MRRRRLLPQSYANGQSRVGSFVAQQHPHLEAGRGFSGLRSPSQCDLECFAFLCDGVFGHLGLSDVDFKDIAENSLQNAIAQFYSDNGHAPNLLDSSW